jgi:hypothetical protein
MAEARSTPLGAGQQDLLRGAPRNVVKVGSSLVTDEGRGLDEAASGAGSWRCSRATAAK